jgi:hypothetical protein
MKQSRIDQAIAKLDEEIAILQAARAHLVDAVPKPVKKPRAVPHVAEKSA